MFASPADVFSVLAQDVGILLGFSQPIQMRFNELIAGVRGDIAVKVFGDNFANTGSSSPTARTVATTAPVATGSCANMRAASSTLGQLTLTSMATTASAMGVMARAALAKSSTVRPQIETMTGTPCACSAGQSSRIQASTRHRHRRVGAAPDSRPTGTPRGT